MRTFAKCVVFLMTLVFVAGCGSGGSDVPVVYNNDVTSSNTNNNTVPPGTTPGDNNNGNNNGDDPAAAKGRLQVNLTVLAPPMDTTRQDDERDPAVTEAAPINYIVTVNAHLQGTAENLVGSATVTAGEENTFFTNAETFVGVWDVRVDVKTDADPPVLIVSTTPVPVTVVEGKTAILPLTIALPNQGDAVIVTPGDVTQF